MLKSFINDEAGVIVSAEIVLVATILVLGMIVGLVELQTAVVSELADLSVAFGNLDQSYSTSGFAAAKDGGSFKARTFGAAYADSQDICDGDDSLSIVCDDDGEDDLGQTSYGPKRGGYRSGGYGGWGRGGY
jgi:secreted trypsin-like serine protease